MTALDSIISRELPVIRQIIDDETWLEAERRGCCVLSDDRVVRENVCRVVLRIGAQLRESAQRAMAADPSMNPHPNFPEAAPALTLRGGMARLWTLPEAVARQAVQWLRH